MTTERSEIKIITIFAPKKEKHIFFLQDFFRQIEVVLGQTV